MAAKLLVRPQIAGMGQGVPHRAYKSGNQAGGLGGE